MFLVRPKMLLKETYVKMIQKMSPKFFTLALEYVKAWTWKIGELRLAESLDLLKILS